MPVKTDSADTASNPESEGKNGGTRFTSFKNWLPAIFAILLTPLATLAIVQYVIIPQLQKSLLVDGVTSSGNTDASSPPTRTGGHSGAGPSVGGRGNVVGKDATTFKFENVVVNLAGSMGTRYLKVSFLVTGTEKTLADEFEQKKAQLLDVTLNVLSSLSLADLEEAGARNILRERLVSSLNQAVGRRLAEQVYFTDFVVQ